MKVTVGCIPIETFSLHGILNDKSKFENKIPKYPHDSAHISKFREGDISAEISDLILFHAYWMSEKVSITFENN